MSEGDGRGDRPRKKKFKKRVTLRWQGKPLSLPGEDRPPSGAHDLSDANALELPESSAGEQGAPSEPTDPPRRGFDAWQRQRQAVTPPPFRPPALKAKEIEPPITSGDALSLVDGRSRPPMPVDLLTEMHDRYALGDYTAALRTAELILGRQPDHREACMVSEASRERLGQLYTSRLGSLSSIPVTRVDASAVRWLGLDHRAGFLFSQIDGVHSYEELIDVSGMARLEALKTFVELLDLGALGVSDS